MRTRHILPSLATLTFISTPVLAADELPTFIVSEPVQYVPQHDKCAYFTPGICTRMKGEIRARLVLPGEFDELTIDPVTNAIGLSSTGGQSYESRVRGRFEFEAIRDLEPGELKSKLRLQAESKSPQSGNASVVVDQAYIELRPLFVGYSDSAWVMTTNDGDTGFGGFGIFDGAYGDQQRNLIQFQVNDLTDNRTFFAISLEDDGDMTSWTPDLVARAGIALNKNTHIFAVAGYDQDNGVTSAVWNALGGAPLGLGSAELGFELGLRTDIADAHRLHLQGFYATGNTAYKAELAYLGVNWTPRWSALTSFKTEHTAKLVSYINAQYFADIYAPTNTNSGMNAWTISGGIELKPVKEMSFTFEGKYTHVNTNGYFNALGNPREDVWEAVMQMQHKF